jgi:hypothetical protein
MNPKEAPVSVLGPAFWCAAPVPIVATPVPIVAICLGFVVTPTHFYDEFLGELVSAVAVYGFTGFFGAAVSFLTGLFFFFPERLGSLTFNGRLAIVLSISACSCAGAVGLGLSLLRYNYVPGPNF